VAVYMKAFSRNQIANLTVEMGAIGLKNMFTH